MHTIYVMSIANALFLAFLLVVRHRYTNVVANRWLAGFLLMLAGLMADDCWSEPTPISESAVSMLGFAGFVMFAISPCLYLSVLSFSTVRFRFGRRQVLHFLPWVVGVLIWLTGFWVLDRYQLRPLSTTVTVLIYLLEFSIYAAVTQNVVYTFLALRQLAAHQRNIRLIAATTDQIDLYWLQRFITGVPILLSIWGTVLLFGESGWIGLYPLVLLVMVYYLGYCALNQPVIYPLSPVEATEIETVITHEALPKTSTPLLNAGELDHWKTVLIERMEHQKPYTDSELALPTLARQLGLSPHKLSYLLNQGFAENFFQFINRYRVEDSKRLLADPRKRHLNILEIGYEAGFNSKTAFNTTFKRLTKLSPSEYQKNSTFSNVPLGSQHVETQKEDV